MRVLHLAVLLAIPVGLAACHPKRDGGVGFAHRPFTVGAVLVCPDQVKALTRETQAPDGQSCTYKASTGEEVQLLRLSLNGQTPQDRLTSLDKTLRTDVPAAVGTANGQGVYVSSDTAGGRAHIDLPGFHLNATDGKASIKMPGVTINADGNDAKVVTTGGGQSVVTAHGGGAEVRTGGVSTNGADITYLLTSDTAGPSGYRVVGYKAQGPAAGPLVVGVFRARDSRHSKGPFRGVGIGKLMDMNVHG